MMYWNASEAINEQRSVIDLSKYDARKQME